MTSSASQRSLLAWLWGGGTSVALVLLLATVFVAGWRLVWDVPLYGKPLEELHAEVVYAIKRTGELPTIIPNELLQEYHQAPLYYLLVSVLSAREAPPPFLRHTALPPNPHYLGTVIGNRHQYLRHGEGEITLYAGRLLGLGSFLLTVLLTYHTARMTFGERTDARWLALLAAALLGLHPEALFIATSM